MIAPDLDHLHNLPNLYLRNAFDENGNRVKGQGERPNEHNILTGPQADGTACFPWQEGDKNRSNWTSNGEGSATRTATVAEIPVGTPRTDRGAAHTKTCKALVEKDFSNVLPPTDQKRPVGA